GTSGSRRFAGEYSFLEDENRDDRWRQHLRSGTNLRAERLRQIVPGESGFTAATGEVGDRGLHRGHGRGNRGTVAQGLEASIARPAKQCQLESRSLGGAPRPILASGSESSCRPGSVRAMAPFQAG